MRHRQRPVSERALSGSLKSRVRDLLTSSGHLAIEVDRLADDADLYANGLSSHATVNLMLSLEEAFDVEFPDRFLRRQTFASVDTIVDALLQMGVEPGTP